MKYAKKVGYNGFIPKYLGSTSQEYDFTRLNIQAENDHYHAKNLAGKLGKLGYDKIVDQVIYTDHP